MNILIIPARGGSKRIPRKNIKEFKGKPIIERTINAVKNLNFFQKIIVSTDDKEIAEIASLAGAEIPFLRPKDLSDDFTNTRDVILHAIGWYESNSIKFDKVCCLYPTAVLLDPNDLIKGIKLLGLENDQKYVFSAVSYAYPIQRAFYLDKKGFSRMVSKENYVKRTQELQNVYHDAGQFYLATSKTWLNNNNILNGARPLIIPRWRGIDIDNEEDWEMAEFLYEFISNQKLN